MQKITPLFLAVLLLASCGAAGHKQDKAPESATQTGLSAAFDADSAFAYVRKQTDFGPRVPNSEAHDNTRRWLVGELRRHGAQVVEQNADLKAFDGTTLKATNIIGRINPDVAERTLLLAHYDCRPWADKDPDPAKHKTPVDGANDAASGVGVLLEVARQLKAVGYKGGVDILFVDAEDYGDYDNDDSWALGAEYFVSHPFVEGYSPSKAILLDMVGGRGATFLREHFSQQAAPQLADALWATASGAGFAEMFPNRMGTAVNDDHLKFIEAGIPAVDIIDFRADSQSFCPTWHTTADNIDNIDPETLRAVGQTLLNYLLQ